MMKYIISILIITVPFMAHADSRFNFGVSKNNITVPTGGPNQSIIAIFNPSTSTKRVLIKKIFAYHESGNPGDGVQWTIRRNAVFSSSGTLENIKNWHVGGGNSSEMEAGFQPSIDEAGVPLLHVTSYRDTPLILDIEKEIIVRPGKNLYIRGKAISSAIEVSLTVLWEEDKK